MTSRWQWWKQTLMAGRRGRGRMRRSAWEWTGLWLERLEDRTVPAVYRVTGTADGLGVVTPSATPGVDFDASTLRAAVIAANASVGVADTILLPAGTYKLTLTGTNEDAAATGDLDITDNLTITGAGAASTAVDGNLTDRVFEIFGGTTVSMSGLTVQNGRAQPGDTKRNSGTDDALGGGILSFGSLTLDSCVVTGNQANGADDTPNAGNGQGGGIYTDGPNLTLRNTIVSNNQANGGAVTTAPGNFGSGGSGLGGGIFINSGSLDISGSVLSNNLAQGGDGTGDYGGFGGDGDGGALATSDDFQTVVGPVTIQTTTLSNNEARGGSGAAGTFSGGFNGTGQGGGINSASPDLIVNNTTINGNSADDGGGLWNIGSDTITNTTFNGNQARNNGGGIFETVPDPTTLNNVTITANIADADGDGGGDGGGVFNQFGSVQVQSTIIAGNFDNSPAGGTIDPDISGDFVSQGHNLIGDATGGNGFTDGVLFDQVGSATATINPLLGPLADNGGPTQTDALLPGSPAINQGANPLNLANDQRGPGFARTVGPATDVGAFEFQGTPDLAITKVDGLTSVIPGQTVTYTLTITQTAGEAATGVVVTDTLPANTTFVSASGGGTFANGVVTFNVGTVGVGQSVTRTVTLQVNNPIPAGVSTIVNTATVTDDGALGADPTPGDNTATATDTINGAPNLAIAKDDGLTSVIPGQVVTYTVAIANLGNRGATGVVVTDTLPANTTFVSASGGGTLADGVVTWDIGALAGGGAGATRTLTVQVNNPVPAGASTIVNTATVSDDGTNGPDPATATDTDVLIAAPDLAITKDDGLTTVTPGQSVTYALTVANVGNQGATGVVVTDTLPANVTFVSASDGGTLASGVVTWNIGTLTGGGTTITRTLTVQVNANATPGGTVTNTATVADDGTNGPDPTPGNNTATDTDQLPANQPTIQTTGFAQATVGPAATTGLPTVTPTVVSKVFLLGSNVGQSLAGDTAGPTAYVNSLYHVLLDRAPTVDEVNQWVFQLQAGVSRSVVAAQVYALPEHLDLIVQRYYLAFLHRTGSPDERAYWVNLLQSGVSETEVARQFILSPEYQSEHADSTSFVTGLYTDVLGRVPAATEVAYWVQILQNGASRSDVAEAFLTSTEANQQLVTLYYQVFLGRSANAAEVQYWLALLQSGSLSPTDVAVGFLTSAEFYGRPR